jgi:hypothetical protein
LISFEPLDSEKQQADILFAHLGKTEATLESSHVDTLLNFCCGLPIALATAAALVRRLNFDWPRIEQNLKEGIWNPSSTSSRTAAKFSVRGGHDGLAAVFSVGLRALEDSSYSEGHPDYSWTDLYISLTVVDKSMPHVPVGLLAILWDTSAAVAEQICLGFQDLALGQLKSGVCTAAGTFKMHDLQLAYAAWRSDCEELLYRQTVSGKDLIALSCKVNNSFEDVWGVMHEECGCETQRSKALDVALALDATISSYRISLQFYCIAEKWYDWARVQMNVGNAL